MNHGRRHLLLAIAAAVILVGCPGKKDGGGCGIKLEPFGGYAVVVVSDTGATAAGGFYSAVTPEEPVYIPTASDDCNAGGGGDPFGNLNLTVLNAGSNLTFTSTSPAVTLVALQGSSGRYSGTLGFAVPPDIDFAIVTSGSPAVPSTELGVVHVPGPIPFTAPAIVAGAELPLAFPADTGADVVGIHLTSANGITHWTCYVKPDGAFVLPTEVTAAIGSGGTISLRAEIRERAFIENRDVILIGATTSE